MPLHSLDTARLREACRSRIESLEIWLRRIVHEELSAKYGQDYVNFAHKEGDFLIKKEIREGLNSRYKKEYPRIIDAAFFEDLIYIISNPVFYQSFFKAYFAAVYPNEMPSQYIYLRHQLEKQKNIRNNLSHAGSLSIRDAEYTLSFTTELFESFKDYYKKKGKEMEYNVPQIIRITDSFGNVITRKNLSVFEQHDFSSQPQFYLRPGDILSITIEVDPSYTDANILYRFGGAISEYRPSNKMVYTITNSDVSPRKVIHCQVQSTKGWHKYPGRGDDQVDLYYKVLPPIEN